MIPQPGLPVKDKIRHELRFGRYVKNRPRRVGSNGHNYTRAAVMMAIL